MEAMEELSHLAESMMQAAALLADEDVDEGSAKRRTSTFLNVVALGNVVRCWQISSVEQFNRTSRPGALRHSLQDRLSKGSGRSHTDEIYLKLQTSTGLPISSSFAVVCHIGRIRILSSDRYGFSSPCSSFCLPRLIPLEIGCQRLKSIVTGRFWVVTGWKQPQWMVPPGSGWSTYRSAGGLVCTAHTRWYMLKRQSLVSDYGAHNDAILLVVVPAAQAPEISSSRALRLAKEFDGEAQAGSVGSESSLETAWRAETESLKTILTGAPQNKLGRIALVDTLAKQIRKRMKIRMPNLLSGLQGKSQIVQDELFRLGEQMVQSAEGTRAIALELCREFEDKFLQHIASGEVSGCDICLVLHFFLFFMIVLEADGYQPYLISPEKGLRSLIKGVLELAKEPSRLCVDEVMSNIFG
ncbi:hypothetical protein BHE74_00034148 [Ensete ventricosum]|nr:hypothetical protein BHE74_00034148 [Ensete ventricosum]